MSRDHLDQLEIVVRLVNLDHQDSEVNQAAKGHQDKEERLVLLVHVVPEAKQDQQALQDQVAQEEKEVKQDQQEHQVCI